MPHVMRIACRLCKPPQPENQGVALASKSSKQPSRQVASMPMSFFVCCACVGQKAKVDPWFAGGEEATASHLG